MTGQGMNISQAARKLGVSVRTIRRYIKAGKIKAELVNGRFGEEYHILQLPPEFFPKQAEGETPTPKQPPGQTPDESFGQAMDIIRELQEKNLALAAQLGVATERVRNLENQVKLLAVAKQPWWKRLFAGRAAK